MDWPGQETLANISACSLNVENASGCAADSLCMWKPMFESGVCLLDPSMTTTSTTTSTTTTTAAATTTTPGSEGTNTTTTTTTTLLGEPSSALAAKLSVALLLTGLAAVN